MNCKNLNKLKSLINDTDFYDLPCVNCVNICIYDEYMDRLGDQIVNFNNELMTIVEYNSPTDIVVEFEDEMKTRKRTTYGNFKRAQVKNPNRRSVYGVGFIGEGKHRPSIGGKNTKTYNTWLHMIKRCYCDKSKLIHPSYSECSVSEEWHNFQNFADWYDKNYYEIENEIMHLDKDLLVEGNKTYGGHVCVFAPATINCMVVNSSSKEEKCVGVYKNSENSYYVMYKCTETGKYIYKSGFKDEQEAFECYKYSKEKQYRQIATKYKGKIPNSLYIALMSKKVVKNN